MLRTRGLFGQKIYPPARMALRDPYPYWHKILPKIHTLTGKNPYKGYPLWHNCCSKIVYSHKFQRVVQILTICTNCGTTSRKNVSSLANICCSKPYPQWYIVWKPYPATLWEDCVLIEKIEKAIMYMYMANYLCYLYKCKMWLESTNIWHVWHIYKFMNTINLWTHSEFKLATAARLSHVQWYTLHLQSLIQFHRNDRNDLGWKQCLKIHIIHWYLHT